MKGKRQGPAALAATLALSIVLTGCAAVSGAVPSASPAPAADQEGLLEEAALYDLDYDLRLAIPSDLDDQLLVELPEAGDDFLVSVWEKRSYEAAGGGDTDMGWLFTLARWDQATYEQYLISDGSGVQPFGYGDGWYYVWLFASDVRFYSDAQDQAALEEQSNAWETLNSRLPEEVKADFIARNGLEAYDNSMYFHDGYLWEIGHRYVCFHADNQNESLTLLLSQPARQGQGGIWCVEGWVDNNYGTRYLVLPRDTGTTAADYYTQLQQQADEGHRPGLLDPLSAAREWLSAQGYNVGTGHVELLEGTPAWMLYDREILPILEQACPLTLLTYENGQETGTQACGTSAPSSYLRVRVWAEAQAPETLSGEALTCTAPNGDSLLFMKESGLVRITREGRTDWYACAYSYGGPNPFESIYVEAFYREWAERNQIPVQSSPEAEQDAPAI